MGNTTASLTHEQLFGGGQQSRKPARHQTGRALYRNLHDAHRMRPNDSGQQLDGRDNL
jgi:hypothetical protein